MNNELHIPIDNLIIVQSVISALLLCADLCLAKQVNETKDQPPNSARATEAEMNKPTLSQPPVKDAESITSNGYYQFGKVPSHYLNEMGPKPSMNLRSPLPSSSLNQLMNSFLSSFSRKMARRSGNVGSMDPNLLYNSIPGSSGAPMEYNMGNLNSLNEALGSAMFAMNDGMPLSTAAQSTVINQISSFLSSNLGKGGKRFFYLPKQLYKAIGDRLTGASEAAVVATTPIKDSLLGTLKSMYSYIKPSRSYDAGLAGQEFASTANSLFNFKRRQSDILPQFSPHPQHAVNLKPHQLAAAEYNQHHAHPQYFPANVKHGVMVKANDYGHFANYYKLKPELGQGGEYSKAKLDTSSALYKKSKELFEKISRKRLSSGLMRPQPSNNYAAYLNHPSQLGLSSQTISKVQSKLAALPPGSIWKSKQPQSASVLYNSHSMASSYPNYLTRSQMKQLSATPIESVTSPSISTSTSMSMSVSQSMGEHEPDPNVNADNSIPDKSGEDGEATSLYYYDASPGQVPVHHQTPPANDSKPDSSS